MNMPVLPVSSPAADVPAPQSDAKATANDGPAFAHVLSGQAQRQAHGSAPAKPTASRPRDTPTRPMRISTRRPEALTLILDSASLPLMQAVSQNAPAPRTLADPGNHALDAADEDRGQRGPGRARQAVFDGEPRTAGDAGTRPAADTNALAGLRRTRPDTPDRQAAGIPSTLVPADNPATEQPPHAGRPQARQNGPEPRSLAAQIALGTGAVGGRGEQTGATNTLTAPSHDPSSGATPRADGPSGAFTLAIPPSADGAPAAGSPSTAAQASTTLTLPTRLDQPQWAQDFSRQVVQLAQSGSSLGHTVQMHVNPPELGPIHITLHLNDSVTQAAFVSPHANVRQALESALPQLAQQLAQAGLSLGQADVGGQQAGQQGFGQFASNAHGTTGTTFAVEGANPGAPALHAIPSAPVRAGRADGLVDTFA